MTGDARTGGESLVRGYTGRISFTLAAGWFVLLMGREAIPPLLTTITGDLGIPPSLAGLAMSGLGAAYALSQYPGGRFSDRLSRRTVLVGSLGVALLGFGSLAVTTSYPVFVAGVLLVGVGAGAYFPSTRGLLSDLFAERRGGALGIQSSAGSVGSALSAGLAILVLSTFVWQAAFVPVVVGVAVVGYLLHRWVREAYVFERPGIDVRRTVRRLSLTGRVRRLLVVYSLFMLYWQGVIVFVPTFLEVEKGLSPTGAAVAFGGLYVIGILVAPAAGNASDRYGRVRIGVACLATTAVGLVVLLAAGSIPLVALGIVVLGVGARSFPPVMSAYLLDLFPDESVAGDFGALKTVYSGVGSLGPAYVGLVAERGSYSFAFAGYVPLLVLAIALLAWIRRSG